MSEQLNLQNKVLLIRAAVWGQAVGMLVMALILAIEDSPDFLKRTEIWSIILPVAAIILIQLKRPSIFFARSLSIGMMTLFVLTISISTTAIALANLLHAYAIPNFLVTSAWQYTRVTSILLLIVFSGALIINIVLIFHAHQGRDQ